MVGIHQLYMVGPTQSKSLLVFAPLARMQGERQRRLANCSHCAGKLGPRAASLPPAGANRQLLYGAAAQKLSQNEVSLLDAVAGPGQVRLSDLVAWQGVDKSTVTPQVRKLEERGLLQRSWAEHRRPAGRFADHHPEGPRAAEAARPGWCGADRHRLKKLARRRAGSVRGLFRPLRRPTRQPRPTLSGAKCCRDAQGQLGGTSYPGRLTAGQSRSRAPTTAMCSANRWAGSAGSCPVRAFTLARR